MSAKQPVDLKQLRADMEVAFNHFALPPETRKVAYDSALKRPTKASICYRAIARSLGSTQR